VRIFNRHLHSRMPSVPTPARFKRAVERAGVWPMAFLSGGHFLTGCHCKLHPNTKGDPKVSVNHAAAVPKSAISEWWPIATKELPTFAPFLNTTQGGKVRMLHLFGTLHLAAPPCI
jgi:hypothetical protein